MKHARRALLYIAMLAVAVAAFWLIDSFGTTLNGPPTAELPARHGIEGKPDELPHVLVALAAVVILGRLLNQLLRHLSQPPVIGEVVAGIVLGPSVLGALWPDAATFVLPLAVAPYLAVIAQLGVIIYMFLVGLELNPGVLRQRAHATIAISHASITVPFVLGAALALVLYPRLATSDVPFTSFALFIGVATSITAFPVLARILTDLRLQKSNLGIIVLGCAAADDVTAWCLLAFVVGVAQATVGGALSVVGMTLAFILVMFLIVRPLARRLLSHVDETRLAPDVVAVTFAVLLLSALTTETIGIHAIFGAFLLGAVIPHDSLLARKLPGKLEDFVTVLLLPAFFALTGMRTQIGLVSGLEQWLLCGMVIATATAGKFGGAFVAARLTGLGWRDAAAVGVLMNTRGLMELIALNVGLDIGIISPTLFTMMVLMALVTTAATTPVLRCGLLPEQGALHGNGSSYTVV